MKIREVTIQVLCALASLVVIGCPPPQRSAEQASQTSQPLPASFPTTRPVDAEPGSYRLIVRLRLCAIELPLGSASESEEIWRYADEEVIQASRSANLARNGLRVGLGLADQWNDLAAVFKRLTGRDVGYATTVTLPGRPVAIPAKKRQPGQTVFVLLPDGAVNGADYPPGDALLAVDCAVSEEDPATVHVTVVPQIRSSAIETTIVNRHEGAGFEASQEIFSFPSLQFQAVVPGKDFLIIGPSAEAVRPGSVGEKFLMVERAGIRYETVFVLIPEVLAAPIRE
jgi:hypothetical protein